MRGTKIAQALLPRLSQPGYLFRGGDQPDLRRPGRCPPAAQPHRHRQLESPRRIHVGHHRRAQKKASTRPGLNAFNYPPMKTLRLLFIPPFIACAARAADSSTPAAVPTPSAPEKITTPAAQADPAAVEAVLKALHFDEMMGKALDQQKQMIQQMVMRSR